MPASLHTAAMQCSVFTKQQQGLIVLPVGLHGASITYCMGICKQRICLTLYRYGCFCFLQCN